MPLKQTPYGGECPLGKFKINPASPGSYTEDPVEKCISCNFRDVNVSRFDLEMICQCPPDITWQEYEKLKREYFSLLGAKTKQDFQDFVRKKWLTKE